MYLVRHQESPARVAMTWGTVCAGTPQPSVPSAPGPWRSTRPRHDGHHRTARPRRMAFRGREPCVPTAGKTPYGPVRPVHRLDHSLCPRCRPPRRNPGVGRTALPPALLRVCRGPSPFDVHAVNARCGSTLVARGRTPLLCPARSARPYRTSATRTTMFTPGGYGVTCTVSISSSPRSNFSSSPLSIHRTDRTGRSTPANTLGP